jgi:hypothetical protein
VRIALLPLLTLFVGCATQPGTVSPFDAQDEFAAQRERETTVLPVAMDRQTACAHVTEVLMDLDCVLTEVNSELGVIAARPEMRMLPSESMFGSPKRWRACAGKQVTVTVSDQGPDRLRVRATFAPPSPESDQAFETLLRRSIAQEEAR